jgi:putative membrane protein
VYPNFLDVTRYWKYTPLFGMVAALKEQRQTLKQIQRNDYTYESSKTTETVSIALILIGIVSFMGVLVKALNL